MPIDPALMLVAVLAGPAGAAPVAPPFQGPALAQDRVLSRAIENLSVSSSAFAPGGAMPLAYTGYGKSTSFPLSWSAGPPATKAYAVIVEELDGHSPLPVLHWLVYNIPARLTSLGRSIHNRGEPNGPNGLMQGLNSRGGVGYVGPNPAVGEPPHRYHIQVFALSRPLPLGPGATLDQVIQAMSDRVLAEGELVATFQAPEPKPPAS
jgi:Raf kinase inhibitor-like YbhB/YbcL family protein